MKPKHFVLAAVLILLSLLWMPAEGRSFEKPGDAPRFSPEVQAHVKRILPSKSGDFFVVLKNDMTVLMRRQSEYDVVSAQVYVRAGSMYEDRFLTAGLSHYLEHVVSGGTTRSFTEAEAKERLRKLGGATNAYTSNDRTVYFINTSAEHWRDALDLLLSYVTESGLKPEEVAREKSVIQQEYKLGENNPGREMWELFIKTAYQVHPVRHPVIGYEEVFVQQDRQALEEYYLERYQPQNMVVALAGRIDAEEALRFIIKKTERFTRRAVEPVVLPAEPPQLTPRWAETEHPIAQLTQATIGFPSVSLTDGDIFPLDVLAILLGSGETSRLYERLKDREKLVLDVGASNWTPAYAQGQFMISLDLAPGNWPGALDSVTEEVERFKREPVDPEELEKAKKKVVAGHIFGKETVSSMASSLASSYFDTGDPYFDEAYVEGIRRVTQEDILRVARRYLDMNRVNVAVVKPLSAGAVGSPDAASGSSADTEPSKTSSAVDFSRLQNGLKLLLKPSDSLPFVTIQLYGPGGLLLEDGASPGLSAFTSSLLTAGTANLSKQDIARAIEGVGGSIGSGSGNNSYAVSIKVLKEDLEMALDILADIVQNSSFPEEEIAKHRQDTLLAIQKRDESWQAEITRLFKQSYFKEHPYGNDRLGTPEAVKSFSRGDLIRFFNRMVSPTGSVLAVYGDVDPMAIKEMVKKKLGEWEAPAASLPKLPLEARVLNADRTVEKKNEKSSASLFIGTDGLTIEDAERPALDVLDAVLSGIDYPSGRLHEALRGGNVDLVYLVHAYPFYGIKAGYFGIITQTTLANLDRVQGIVLDHLRRLMEEPVGAEELETAKNMVVTMHHMGLESLDAQAQSAAVNEVLGLGWDYDEHYPEKIMAVRSEDVQNIARKLFRHTLIVRTIPENPVEVLSTVKSE